MTLTLDKWERGCLAFGLGVAVLYFVHEWYYPSHYDAYTYTVMGDQIARNGLFSKWEWSDLRTYGYPLFLSIARRLSQALPIDFRLIIFAVQASAWVAAVLFLRHALARIFPAAVRVVFCGLVLNFYVMIFPSATLTESFSLTLTLVVAACWLRLHDRGLDWRLLVAGSLAAGFAMMVRPANLFLPAAWSFALLLGYLRHRPAAPRAALAALVAAVSLALPTLPQLANNVRHYGKWTPLVVVRLGDAAQYWGIRHMKYATAMPPIPKPQVDYINPLVEGTEVDPDKPMQWYFQHPFRGAATIALHTFNMLDQDLLFTYARDLDPWFRIPLGVVNHAVLALGLIGLALLGRRVLPQPGAGRDAFLVLVAGLLANWAVYATSMVEMRFGSVILMAAFPLAGFALALARGRWTERQVDLAGVAVAAYVVAALALSGWVREQSAEIRQARGAPRAAIAPPVAIVLGSPGRDRLEAQPQLAGILVETQLRG